MEKYEIMKNSIYKNIEELSEFLVDNFKVNNYYELVDKMIELYNFRAKTIKANKELAIEIINELEKEVNK